MNYIGDLYAKIGGGRGKYLKLEMTSTDVDNLVEENKALKTQIEKMKCCANCEFQYVRSLAAVIDDESDEPCCSCKEHSNWKLKR